MLFSSLIWNMLSVLPHPHICRHVGRVLVLSAHVCNVEWQSRNFWTVLARPRLKVVEMCPVEAEGCSGPGCETHRVWGRETQG